MTEDEIADLVDAQVKIEYDGIGCYVATIPTDLEGVRQRIAGPNTDRILTERSALHWAVNLIGYCEGCYVPIFEDEKYQSWTDGPITCGDCSNYGAVPKPAMQ